MVRGETCLDSVLRKGPFNNYFYKVWSHTCMSYSRSTGRLKVVVDGVKTADSYYDAIIDWAEEMSKKVC